MSARRILMISGLLAVLTAGVLPLGAFAQKTSNINSRTGQPVFPYEMINYTQAGHEFRVANSEVIVLGQVTEYKEIQGIDKGLNWRVTLRVESFLKTDRPGQAARDEIRFRSLPLMAPYEEIKVGDRCLVLLVRDQLIDSALILPTDLDYYPVTGEGVVTKFFKQFPTAEDPVRREVALSVLREEVQAVLRRLSVEQQVLDADLVLTGMVTRSHQGSGELDPSLVFTTIEPGKIIKGDPGKGVVTLIDRNNVQQFTLETLNRSGFKAGQKVVIFANKDPTFSKKGPNNPEGEDRWHLLHGRQSAWFVARRNTWRPGMRSIPNDEFMTLLVKQAEVSPK